MKKWQKKQLAAKLRRQGLSYKEINAETGLAKSTLSSWLKDIKLSPKQQAILNSRFDTQLRGAKANRISREKEIRNIRKQAGSEIRGKMTPQEFFLSGLMLYWAEGNKTLYPGIANSDPKLIRFMMKWLRKICSIPTENIKIHLHLHSGQNENKAKEYWSNITHLPLSRFGKSYIKKEGSGHRKNILYNGTAKISVYNKDLLYRILSWIQAVRF